MTRIGVALFLFLFSWTVAARDVITGTHLQFIVEHPEGGPVAGRPYVMSLVVASLGAKSAVFDWRLPEKVEWVDERCVATGGNTWRCTLTNLEPGDVEVLEARLVAPLSNASQPARADLVSSDPPESRAFAHLFTVWPRSPADVVVNFIPFDTIDAQRQAELRIELESRLAPVEPLEVRLDIDLHAMRILEMQLPAGWDCPANHGPNYLPCRITLPATGEKVIAILKVQALEARQLVAARLAWIDRGYPAEERVFRNTFTLYERELVVTNTSDSGPGTLRQAMLDASAVPCRSYEVPCRIRFDIPPPPDGQWLTIRPETPLPVIASGGRALLMIDGTTQTKRRDTNPLGPEIELDGSLVREGDGLTVHSTTIKGLAINSFPASGIESSGGTSIQENYIGTDPTGRVAKPNGTRGVTITGGGVTVENNVISGNHRSGVFAFTGSGTIRGNLIGVSADGVTPLPNGASGVFGGPRASLFIEDNVIAYNGHFGIGILGAPQGTLFNRPSVVARANRTYANVIAAIDQGLDGPGSTTPAPPPLLTSATYDPATNFTIIRGTIERAGGDGFYSYTIFFYASATSPPSGFGEGETYLGSVSVRGTSFTFRMAGDVRGKFVSAHLTRLWVWAELSDAVTSEFGNVVEVR